MREDEDAQLKNATRKWSLLGASLAEHYPSQLVSIGGAKARGIAAISMPLAQYSVTLVSSAAMTPGAPPI